MKKTKKVLKRVGVYVLTLLGIYIIGAIIFPTDENNIMITPGWYDTILFLLPIAVAIFYDKLYFMQKSSDVGPKDTSENIKTQSKSEKIPFSKKKRKELAAGLLAAIKADIDLANKSTSVGVFLIFYDHAISKIERLIQFEGKVRFTGEPPTVAYHRLKNEMQWHLCDAIVRAKETAISEIQTKYKNTKEYQKTRAESFARDIEDHKNRFSEGTKELADEAVLEVKKAAKIQVDETNTSKLYAFNFAARAPGTLTAGYDGVEAELLTIDIMEGHDFEHWCAGLLRSIGYCDVEVTRGSGDQGVDILAKKDGIKYAIQCKCYSSPLGNKPIQEVNTGKTIYRCQIGAVMTNQSFTNGAKEAAGATGVLLWDREWIKKQLENRKNQAGSK